MNDAANFSVAPISEEMEAFPGLTAIQHDVEPFRQGELDRLCGLYAIINGIRLALKAHDTGLTPKRSRTLFEVGSEFLTLKRGLQEALGHGMGLRRWHALARHLARAISDDVCTVTVETADVADWRGITDAWRWIDQSLGAKKPVLIPLLKGMDHYSVVMSATPLTLRLFDSVGVAFVRKASCGFTSAFHIVPPKGLLRIAVQRPG